MSISGFVADSAFILGGGWGCLIAAATASGGGCTVVDGVADTSVGTGTPGNVVVVDTGGVGSVATGELLVVVACCSCEANCFWAWTTLAAATAAMVAGEGSRAESWGAPAGAAAVDFGVVLDLVLTPAALNCDAGLFLLPLLLLVDAVVPSAMDT